MKTITLPLNVAREIALMIPSASVLRPDSVAYALALYEAIEKARREEIEEEENR